MSRKRTVANLSRTLTLVLLVTLGVLPVNNAASSPPAPPPETSDSQGIGSLSGVLACGNAFEQGGSSGYRCFMEQMVNGILMEQEPRLKNRLIPNVYVPRESGDEPSSNFLFLMVSSMFPARAGMNRSEA